MFKGIGRKLVQGAKAEVQEDPDLKVVYPEEGLGFEKYDPGREGSGFGHHY